MIRTYSEMSEREAILHRALSRIAEGADPSLRPSHPDYLNKSAVVLTALAALAAFDAAANSPVHSTEER